MNTKIEGATTKNSSSPAKVAQESTQPAKVAQESTQPATLDQDSARSTQVAACACGEHEGDDLMRINQALSAIPDEELIFSATEIFSALADSTRFRILSALSMGELCVSDLLCATNVSQSAVSHQLRFLRDKKLVRGRREGQKSMYSLADDHVKSLISLALEHAAE